MQIDHQRLRAGELRRRQEEGLCRYCGSHDHLLANCPLVPVPSGRREGPRRHDKGVSDRTPRYSVDHFTFDVEVRAGQRFLSLSALIDSGAAGNLISAVTAERLHLPLHRLPAPISIHAADRQLICGGTITHYVGPVDLRIKEHQEEITFFVISPSKHAIILGLPWLTTHNPNINWRRRDMNFPPSSTPTHTSVVTCASTSVESPSTTAPTPLPVEYRDLAAVFSKIRATCLPPHRPWDCAIDLLAGTSPPRSRSYPLSQAEHKVMEQYIEEALRQGFIRPSTSPAAAGFFFVAKKDGGLRPCIDYRGLNNITVKYRYPLPLVPNALDQLRGARFFTKLDLRSAYNLVRIREGDEWKTAFNTPTGHYEYKVMPYGLANAPSVFQGFMNDVLRDMLGRSVITYIDDIIIYSTSMAQHVQHVRRVLECLLANSLFVKLEKCQFHCSTVSFLGYVIGPEGVKMETSKVDAVSNWPFPRTVKDLQRFLGFANFYRRFICGFSTSAAPLTSLLKGKPRRLSPTPEAEVAFEKLKQSFTTAPILQLPDPALPFIVEVDASEVGVGAVLYQRSGDPAKLHPCAFFSRKLSPAEHNYDVGDRELLAVKMALEEWRHWLEGALHPFLVLTDHRNLEYLRSARRLNPRQARWAIFFVRFAFTISYRPGSKNIKADALSRRYDSAAGDKSPTTILPDAVFLCPIAWDLDADITQARRQDPTPPSCPRNREYVPLALHDRVIAEAHTSVSAGHPGARRTTHLIQQRYWWSGLASDVEAVVRSCSLCATTKTPRHLPAGKLHPLPVPQRPWTHLAVDFVTDLPASGGHTVILVVVDRFSKHCKFIPFTRLPTALQVAEAMFHHVLLPPHGVHC